MPASLYFFTIAVLGLVSVCCPTALLAGNPASQAAPDQAPPGRLPPVLRLYEWRVLQAAPGKLDALHTRLRDHQIPTLEQHGIFTQGVFVPAGENPDQRVHLLVAAEGQAQMHDGWAAFSKDPKWLEAVARSKEDAGGKLVLQEDDQRLVNTDWSPAFTPTKSAELRVFELRTYTCPDHEKQTALQRRFREHTMKLFEKHGMQNIVYWVLDKDEPEFHQKLIYLLAHKSQNAAKESFAAFRKDPDWLAAKEASEKAAGGSLTAKEKGVVSEFLEATDYSPLK
jgi:hypothetical protein